ncbi:MAG TPA: hypothetical protein VM557_12360 [Thermoanaerobaculia bacterium]|nr:hypothetical protein [Thermoanaerobaculia bacterium]
MGFLPNQPAPRPVHGAEENESMGDTFREGSWKLAPPPPARALVPGILSFEGIR